MFDNPKKELERLEQQLLAAETDYGEFEEAEDEESEEFDRVYADIYDEFGREEPYEMDEELQSMFSRSAGYEETCVMDEDRYVPARKKSFRGLVTVAILLPLTVIAFVVWYFWRFL